MFLPEINCNRIKTSCNRYGASCNRTNASCICLIHVVTGQKQVVIGFIQVVILPVLVVNGKFKQTLIGNHNEMPDNSLLWRRSKCFPPSLGCKFEEFKNELWYYCL